MIQITSADPAVDLPALPAGAGPARPALPSGCASPPADPVRSTGLRPVAAAWEALLSLVYPPHCLACRAPLEDAGEGLCRACWHRVQVITDPVCDRCGCPVERAVSGCDNCCDKAYEFTGLRCLAPFGPEIQGLVHGLKYNGRVAVAQVLGHHLGVRLAACGFAAGVDLLHPVPLFGARRRERGYNQSALIARAMSKVLQRPVVTGLVRRDRQTVTQTGLDLEARAENVRDAFQVRKVQRAAGKRVLLVDDVVTTGATCNACAEALLAAGADEVRVAAIASPYFCPAPGAPDAGSRGDRGVVS